MKICPYFGRKTMSSSAPTIHTHFETLLRYIFVSFQQITVKLGNCNDFQALISAVLTDFGLLVPVKSQWKNHGRVYREEKSLRRVAMVAKFLDDNKPKTWLKKWIRTASNFIDLIQFHLIWQMLAKFPRVESERTVSKFRRGKRQLLCCVHLLHKASVWN